MLIYPACIDIDLVKDIEFADDSFSKLVLPIGHDKIVKSLVLNHLDTRDTTMEGEQGGAVHADLVRGKGKGLIILLHGAPGVGKTSTAECIAEYTKRPLFPLTCGDIGETAGEVTTKLEATFLLAHRWNAVLLLDEADVFLAKREKLDLKRNALVSVFLRTLEYYAGILFLTTNRTAQFDEAFKSRIHMSLYYPPLDRDKTVAVWKTNIGLFEQRNKAIKEKKAPGVVIKFSKDEIINFAIDHFDSFEDEPDEEFRIAARWNGRQIRNAFQTAMALAIWDARDKESQKFIKTPVLDRDHFDQVADASRDFDQYLSEILGGIDQAQEEQLRKDDWTPNPSKTTWAMRETQKLSKSSRTKRSSKEDERDSVKTKRNSKDSKVRKSEAPAAESAQAEKKAKKKAKAKAKPQVEESKDASDSEEDEASNDEDELATPSKVKKSKEPDRKSSKKSKKKPEPESESESEEDGEEEKEEEGDDGDESSEDSSPAEEQEEEEE
jgi:adenylate kinase family enzyme